MQKSRPTRMVSLALLVALLVGQSPSAWSRPSIPAEATRVTQPVPAFEPLTMTGVLDESSQVEDGRYVNGYEFEGIAGQIVIIDLVSNEFDTLLGLVGPNGEVIAVDNDGGEGTNARLVLSLPDTGAYQIAVLSFNTGGTGLYQLTMQSGTEADMKRAEQLAKATRLNTQGIEMYRAGLYKEAEPLVREALAIRRQQLGDYHPDVAISLNTLGLLYVAQGRFGEAEPLYQESLAISREKFGERHLSVANILNNLAILYQVQGRFGEAEPLYQESLAISREKFGNHHLNVATSLNNFANFYHIQGQFWEAEPLYQESLSILREQFGGSHPDVATSLNNLATLYHDQGRYEEAEPLYQESLNIRRERLDTHHPDIAQSLNNLAGLYRAEGRYGEAELLYQESLSIFRDRLGDRHTSVAQSLNNLAALYEFQGRVEEADQLYQESLSILREQLGDRHTSVAQSLNNLAGLYRVGHYGEAAPLYQEALAIRREQLGDRHPDVAQSLNGLATLYWVEGSYDNALTWLQQGLAIEETNLSLNLAIGSDDRKRAYIATISWTTDFAISLHLQDASTNPIASRLALTTVLRRKGRVLDAVTDTQQLLRQNLSPDLSPLLDDFTAVQTQLAAQLYAGLGDQDPEVYRARIDNLRQEANRLENELSRRSAEFRVETEPVEIEAVQALIPADAALVELVQYQPFNPAAANQAERWGNPRYAAYILHHSGDPKWVDLGDAETIDTAARAFLAATRTPNNLSQARTTARALDELVMAPIRPLLGDATHLLLSPDSQLNLVPFAALLDEQDRYLAQTYTLTHLTTGRDLLRLQNPAPSQQPPVIFANPNYDTADPSGTQLIATSLSTSPRPQGEGPGVRGDQRSGDIANLRFGPLPGTQQEIDAITPLLPDNAVILTEANATENALKQVQAPSILHIATHGFFLEDVEFVPPPGATRGDRAAILVEPIAPAAAASRPTSNEDPLLRSGLAFAGFNSRDSAGEDGVLTALEATGLNLRGTRLVVMSACETGVGQVANGEGVYGLRRAFVMAGAESQLMSLWKVHDFATAELMQRYYQRLQDGEGRSEALRQVQLEFLEAPAYQHPYYWASFLFSGEWSPMSDR